MDHYSTVYNSDYKVVEVIEYDKINIYVLELLKGQQNYGPHVTRNYCQKGYKAVIWCSNSFDIKDFRTDIPTGDFLPPSMASKKLGEMVALIETGQIKFMIDGKETSINKKSIDMKTNKNYFKGIESLDEAKKLYWSLAKKLHPDVGGTKEAFQDLQAQFENFRPEKEKFKGEFDQWQAAPYMAILEQLMKIENIVINICGSWIWLSGDTKPVKEQIKAINTENTGFKRGFSKNKMQWYFSPEGYRKSSKKVLSFDDIKDLYGHKEMESEGQVKISA